MAVTRAMVSSTSLILFSLLFSSAMARHNRHSDADDSSDEYEPERDLFPFTDIDTLLLSHHQSENQHTEPLKTNAVDPTISYPFKFIALKGSKTLIADYGRNAKQEVEAELALKISQSGVTTIDLIFKNFVKVKYPRNAVSLKLELIYGANKVATVSYIVDYFEDWCPTEGEYYVCARAPHTLHQIKGVKIPEEWGKLLNDETPFSTLTVSLIELPMNNILMSTSTRAKVV